MFPTAPCARSRKRSRPRSIRPTAPRAFAATRVVWAVGAKRIEVRSFPGLEEDELEVVEDGQFVVGRRLDGDLFEVRVAPI